LINFLGDSKLSSLKKILKLRAERYQKSFMIFPANHYLYQVVTFSLGAKERFGHDYQAGAFPDFQFLYNRRIKEDRSLHCVEENFRLFEFGFDTKLSREYNLSIPVSKTEEAFATQFIANNKIVNHELVGIHAGCDVLKNMIHKRWSTENYGKFIKKISLERPNTRFLLFGGPAEHVINEEIAAHLPGKTLIVKNTSFLQSAAIMSKCKMFVANDSGLMHTAAALQLPVLAIFGPTNPVYLRPYRSEHEIVQKDFSCQPCFEYARKPLICNQSDKYKCVKQITVDNVYEKFTKLYNRIK
jgi:heptosyltransferase-2